MLGHRPLAPEDYFAILKRRWWIVLLPLLVLPIVSYCFSYTIPPEYLSQTLVLVQGQQVSEGYVKPVLTEDLDSQLATLKEQIMSRARLQPILENYNLFSNLHMDMDDRIEQMRKNIDIKPIHSEIGRGLPGFYISFKASDPRIAQAVCTEITSMFTNQNLQLRQQSAEGTTDFLKSQLDNAKHNLDEQDAKLAEFQQKNMGKLPGEEGSNASMLTSLNTQLEAANQAIARMEQDRSLTQTLLAQATQTPVSSGVSSPVAISAAPNPALDSEQTELQALQAQEADLTLHYTADYPEVVAVRRKIADLRKKMAQQATAPSVARGSGGVSTVRESPAVLQLRAQLKAQDLGIQEKRQEQAQIQANIRSYQDRLQSSPGIEAQFKQLTRDYQTAQAFYDDLLSKMNTAKMSTELEKRQEGEHFQVMDAANLPDAPFSPKRTVFAMSGAGFGLALGLIISGLLEYKDTSLRTERDVWAFTNLPTLGLIPISDTPEMKAHRGFKRILGLFKFRRKKQIAVAHG
jgi:polysaccharide chain length determinant protein (PEP-CTERM system associated)